MSGEQAWTRIEVALVATAAAGLLGCTVGVVTERGAIYPAWLCAYLLWLGLPLGALTLVLVHDLTGGAWMTSARPALNAAIATTPVATLAGLPLLFGLRVLYPWSGTAGGGNGWYLNSGFFIARYAVNLALWNLLAGYALWVPRGIAAGIAPSLSWLSALGLVLLAYTAGFAAIDWILSLDPHFWSAAFPMAAGAGWFNTGLALVLLAIALNPAGRVAPEHLADLAALLLATTIFWAYIEFCQFLIVREEDLTHEIPWFLHRVEGGWRAVTWAIAAAGFFLPFLVLLWRPSKRRPGLVAAACGAVLASRIVQSWWLVLPEMSVPPSPWLTVAAMLALGGTVMLLFLRQLRRGDLPAGAPRGVGQVR